MPNLLTPKRAINIWAERYDRAVEDVFAMQDEIVLAVTAAISPLVDDAEQRRAMRKRHARGS